MLRHPVTANISVVVQFSFILIVFLLRFHHDMNISLTFAVRKRTGLNANLTAIELQLTWI